MDLNLQKTAKDWFSYAETDLKAASRLGTDFRAITCFHCQQGAEKYIKGLLLCLQVDFRKTHDLFYLLELLPLDMPDDIFEAADYLNEYAVETRYPGDYDEISIDEVVRAINYAKLVQVFVLEEAAKLGIDGYSTPER